MQDKSNISLIISGLALAISLYALFGNKNENRFEKLGLDYHQKILDGFNILYKKHPKRIVKIDASESKEIISDNINYHVSELLNIND